MSAARPSDRATLQRQVRGVFGDLPASEVDALIDADGMSCTVCGEWSDLRGMLERGRALCARCDDAMTRRIDPDADATQIAVGGPSDAVRAIARGELPALPATSDAPTAHRPEQPAQLDGSERPVASADRKLGRYVLIQQIGAGGMGEVWKAHDPQLHRVVAVKLLHRATSDLDRQRFQREARIAANLDHPAIVRTLDADVRDKQAYIVQELVEGVSLSQWLRTREPSPEDALRLLRTLAEGVAYAHQHGVIHRDLKPANVLVDGAHHPKLTDFGLARRMDEVSELSMSGQLLGTPRYMAPEVIRDPKRISPRSDLYGLGTILYEVLTRRPPVVGENLHHVLFRVVEADITPVRDVAPDVPAPIEAIAMTLLARDPAERYADAAALIADIDKVLAGEPIAIMERGRPLGALVGEQLGPYTFEQRVADTPQGVLYRGYHREERRRRLVLVMPPMPREDQGVLEERREALAALAHPGLFVPHRLSWSDGGHPLFELEGKSARSLHEVLRECGALEQELATAITKRLLEALAAVHGAGMVHGRLSPDSLLLVDGDDDDGDPRRSLVRLVGSGLDLSVGGPPPPSIPPPDDDMDALPDPPTGFDIDADAGASAGTPATGSSAPASTRTEITAAGAALRPDPPAQGVPSQATTHKRRKDDYAELIAPAPHPGHREGSAPSVDRSRAAAQQAQASAAGTDSDAATLVQGSPRRMANMPGGSTHITSFDLAMPEDDWWSAPELGGGDTDPRSDLYAAGVLYYQLLTGLPPFSDWHHGAPTDSHGRASVIPLDEARPGYAFHPAIDDVVRRAIASQPAHRFQTADAFVDALPSYRGRGMLYATLCRAPMWIALIYLLFGPVVTQRPGAWPGLSPNPFHRPTDGAAVTGRGILCYAVALGPGRLPRVPETMVYTGPLPLETRAQVALQPGWYEAALRWARARGAERDPGTVQAGMKLVPGTLDGRVHSFHMDPTEVTNAAYRAFLTEIQDKQRELAFPEPEGWQRNLGDDYPVSGISWWEASVYAAWAGKQLPTEDHWRLAAGNLPPKETRYPWGNTDPKLGAHATFSPLGARRQTPVPAGDNAQGGTPEGVFDLAGNVAEWLATEHAVEAHRVVRGGSFRSTALAIANDRSGDALPPGVRRDDVGFRCIVPSDPTGN